MILIDTSVWIDYLQGIQNQHTDALDVAIADGVVAMGDLIFLEILQGIRDDKNYRATRQSLMTLDLLEMFGKGMPEKCAENYRAPRKKGMPGIQRPTRQHMHRLIHSGLRTQRGIFIHVAGCIPACGHSIES